MDKSIMKQFLKSGYIYEGKLCNAFSYINNTLYILLQQWAKHRHPNLQITKTPFLDKDYFDKR